MNELKAAMRRLNAKKKAALATTAGTGTHATVSPTMEQLNAAKALVKRHNAAKKAAKKAALATPAVI
jgi:hypothetical protein